MIDWIATWKAIADAWILQAEGEDPDWVGEQLCALIRCDSAAALEAWAQDVGLKGLEKMIVRRDFEEGRNTVREGGFPSNGDFRRREERDTML